MNGVVPVPLAPPELPDPVDPAEPELLEPAEPEPPPTATTAPVGVRVVAVLMPDTVPVAWIPVTSSNMVTFRPVFTWPAYAGGSSPVRASDPRAASSRNGWPGCWPRAPFTATTVAGRDGRNTTSAAGTPPVAVGVYPRCW